jgi:tetratricopeptide (TPR) repeat protein
MSHEDAGRDLLDPQRERLQLFTGGLILLFATLAAYSPALTAGFIWDDDAHLTANAAVADPHGLVRIWTSADAVYYPLVLTTFWVMHRVWGFNPFPYHLLDILLHAANAFLLVLLLKRARIRGAWLAAALFALHPIHVESAAWVTEIKNTQSGVFFLLCLLAFQQYLPHCQGDKNPTRSVRWYWISLLLFILAITSKPSVVMTPVLLLLYLIWIDRGLQVKQCVLAMPFFTVSLLSAGWTIWEQQYHSLAQGADWSEPLLNRLLISGGIIWFYLKKLLIPYPLVFIYPKWDVSPFDILSYLPLAAALGVTLFLWLRREQWFPLLAMWIYFLVSIFPVLGLFNIYFMMYAWTADHFIYLASLGPIVFFANHLARLVPAWNSRHAWAGQFLAAPLLLLLGALTWHQCHVYRNSESLWRDVIRKNPAAWMAHYNLGMTLLAGRKVDEAIGSFNESLRVKPGQPKALHSLGLALAQQGKLDDAVQRFQQAIEEDPAYSKAYANLGNALTMQGKKEEAAAAYRKALEVAPRDRDAPITHFNLANLLRERGDCHEAIPHYQEAIRLQPDFPQARAGLRVCELDTR